MIRRSLAAATVFLCLAFAWTGPAPAADVPLLTGRVVDNAELLQSATRERIAAALKAHEQATGNQIAVLTVPTIGEESIEQYATEVFEAWKLGQKGRDNGVLLVIAPKDRKLRIEVGYGLEARSPTSRRAASVRRSFPQRLRRSGRSSAAPPELPRSSAGDRGSFRDTR